MLAERKAIVLAVVAGLLAGGCATARVHPTADWMDLPTAQRYQQESCTLLNALPKPQPDEDEYDQPPRLLSQTRPVYPRAAYDAKVEGTIATEILIGVTGDVEAVCVRRPIGGLNQAAVECVKRWKFSPALKDGQPVQAVARAPVTFRIR